jgi:hypothetical protein
VGGARGRAGGLAAVASLVLLAACTGGRTDAGGPSGSVPATTAPERPPAGFYAVPAPLPPGPPGALIRAVPIAGLSVLPDSRAWAVLYHSRDFDGRDVAVSGWWWSRRGGPAGGPAGGGLGARVERPGRPLRALPLGAHGRLRPVARWAAPAGPGGRGH